MEFKVGNNYSYHIDLGKIDFKKKYLILIKKRLNLIKLFKSKKITFKENTYLLDLIHGDLTLTKWKLLNSFFRSKYVLRWNIQEILSQKIFDDGTIHIYKTLWEMKL